MTPLSLADLPRLGPAVVTLGVFDGVHVGHRHLVAETKRAATERGAACVVLVFSPHPQEIILPGARVPRLAPPDVSLARLAEAGADHPIAVRFDDGVRSMSPEEFLAAIGASMELRGVVMTPESAFGRGRAGTPDRVAEIGAEQGFHLIVVQPLTMDEEPVSSSRVRALLKSGAVTEAAELLATPPLLRGTVVDGDHRGRELGFPTANLSFGYEPALPALGIYLGRVHVPERGVGPGHPALVSVGVRPTFHDDGRVLVEVYLLDWDGDLYGTELSVELIDRVREELRFASVDELVAQMRSDEAEARRRLLG